MRLAIAFSLVAMTATVHAAEMWFSVGRGTCRVVSDFEQIRLGKDKASKAATAGCTWERQGRKEILHCEDSTQVPEDDRREWYFWKTRAECEGYSLMDPSKGVSETFVASVQSDDAKAATSSERALAATPQEKAPSARTESATHGLWMVEDGKTTLRCTGIAHTKIADFKKGLESVYTANGSGWCDDYPAQGNVVAQFSCFSGRRPTSTDRARFLSALMSGKASEVAATPTPRGGSVTVFSDRAACLAFMKAAGL